MPKSVQASSTAVPSAAQQSSRASFVDTLASVSSAPVQGPRAAQSEARSASNSNTGDVAQQSQQIRKSTSSQDEKSTSAAETTQQSANETAPTQESNAKISSSSGGSTATKDVESTDEQGSRKTASKKTAFTGQEVASFNLQDLTMQAGLTGMFYVSTATVATDVRASSADATGQPLSTQLATRTIAQGVDTQARVSTFVPASGAGATGQPLSTQPAARTITQGVDAQAQAATNVSVSRAAATEPSQPTQQATSTAAQGTDTQTQVGTDVLADRSGQASIAQPAARIVDQSPDGQSHIDGPNVVAVKGDDTKLAAQVLRAARQADAQGGLVFDPASVAATVVTRIPNTDSAAFGNAVGETNASQAVDSASVLQASLAVPVGTRTAMTQGKNDSNQPIATLLKSKDSEAAAGLKDDAIKTDKDEASSDGHSSSQSPDSALNDLLAVQSTSAHAQNFGSEANALQTVTVTSHTEISDATATRTAASSADTTAHREELTEGAAAGRWQGIESAGMSGINAARLIQNMNGTEMRVGMHSSEFGDISIRTSVSQQQMQTHISVDHNELGNALSAHIPSMQAKMGSDYGLHATIEVNQGGASFSNNGGHSQNQQHQTSVGRIESMGATAPIEHEPISLSAVTYASNDSRLDIRA